MSKRIKAIQRELYAKAGNADYNAEYLENFYETRFRLNRIYDEIDEQLEAIGNEETRSRHSELTAVKVAEAKKSKAIVAIVNYFRACEEAQIEVRIAEQGEEAISAAERFEHTMLLRGEVH